MHHPHAPPPLDLGSVSAWLPRHQSARSDGALGESYAWAIPFPGNMGIRQGVCCGEQDMDNSTFEDACVLQCGRDDECNTARAACAAMPATCAGVNIFTAAAKPAIPPGLRDAGHVRAVAKAAANGTHLALLRPQLWPPRGVDPEVPHIVSRALRHRQVAMVLGEQKCGTTFAWSLLTALPGAMPCRQKESNFFRRAPFVTPCTLRRYLALFTKKGGVGDDAGGLPALEAHPVPERGSERGGFLIEASPEYLMEPFVAATVAATFPQARLIVLTRDPLKRAHAGWDHMRREGREKRSFAVAMEDELKMIADRSCVSMARELGRLSGGRYDEEEASFRFDGPLWLRVATNYSSRCGGYCYFEKTRGACKLYLHKGQMAAHVDVWLGFFPPEQLLLINSSQLYAQPARTLRRMATFLGIEDTPALEVLINRTVANRTRTCWHSCTQSKTVLPGATTGRRLSSSSLGGSNSRVVSQRASPRNRSRAFHETLKAATAVRQAAAKADNLKASGRASRALLSPGLRARLEAHFAPNNARLRLLHAFLAKTPD